MTVALFVTVALLVLALIAIVFLMDKVERYRKVLHNEEMRANNYARRIMGLEDKVEFYERPYQS